jgi:HAMP domain-containing protein
VSCSHTILTDWETWQHMAGLFMVGLLTCITVMFSGQNKSLGEANPVTGRISLLISFILSGYITITVNRWDRIRNGTLGMNHWAHVGCTCTFRLTFIIHADLFLFLFLFVLLFMHFLVYGSSRNSVGRTRELEHAGAEDLAGRLRVGPPQRAERRGEAPSGGDDSLQPPVLRADLQGLPGQRGGRPVRDSPKAEPAERAGATMAAGCDTRYLRGCCNPL